MSYSNLKIIVGKQIKRAEQYIQNKKNMTVVPIMQFSSFIDEFYGNLEKIRTIEK
jgi:uncharacterized protein YrrD